MARRLILQREGQRLLHLSEEITRQMGEIRHLNPTWEAAYLRKAARSVDRQLTSCLDELGRIRAMLRGEATYELTPAGLIAMEVA